MWIACWNGVGHANSCEVLQWGCLRGVRTRCYSAAESDASLIHCWLDGVGPYRPLAASVSIGGWISGNDLDCLRRSPDCSTAHFPMKHLSGTHSLSKVTQRIVFLKDAVQRDPLHVFLHEMFLIYREGINNQKMNPVH